MSDLVTAPRPHPASLEKSHQPDPAHERHDDDSNPAALERSSLPAETATHAGRSSRWTKLVSRLPWAAASTVVLGLIAVVLWRIYAPSPDVWTDDAYVRVHYATIAPRVPGQVTSVRVDDNDTVKAGQVLAELDDRDYRTALEQAEAQVAAAQASVSNVDAQMSVQQAQINANQAQVDQAQANLGLARVTWDRDRPLVHEGWATAQQGTTDVQTLKAQQATVESARAMLKLAQRQVEALKAQRDSAVASLGQAERNATRAKLNLSTPRSGPVDGMSPSAACRRQHVAWRALMQWFLFLKSTSKQITEKSSSAMSEPASAPAFTLTPTTSTSKARWSTFRLRRVRPSRRCNLTTPRATSPRSCSACP
jgi:membrane fusion protein (multidrug efflux system)